MDRYTDLTGEAFRRAHLVRCKKQGKHRSRAVLSRRDVLDAVAVAAGIFFGVILLVLAAEAGLARGAAWACGNYASQPAWND